MVAIDAWGSLGWATVDSLGPGMTFPSKHPLRTTLRPGLPAAAHLGSHRGLEPVLTADDEHELHRYAGRLQLCGEELGLRERRNGVRGALEDQERRVAGADVGRRAEPYQVLPASVGDAEPRIRAIWVAAILSPPGSDRR